jgi:hypothetical protein
VTVQPDLFGGEITVEPKLTAYQQAVWELVQRHPDGVSAEEAGAVYHSMRQRPHDVDARCDYCGRDGRSILEALAKKGLARRRRGAGHMLYVPADSPNALGKSAGPGPGELPEGF